MDSQWNLEGIYECFAYLEAFFSTFFVRKNQAFLKIYRIFRWYTNTVRKAVALYKYIAN